MNSFKPGNLVWAKVLGFPWWPGIANEVLINFIGENSHSFLSEDKLRHFEENLKKMSSKFKERKLKEAIKTAKDLLSDPVSKEAFYNGFETKEILLPTNQTIGVPKIRKKNKVNQKNKNKNTKTTNINIKKSQILETKNLQQQNKKRPKLSQNSKKSKIIPPILKKIKKTQKPISKSESLSNSRFESTFLKKINTLKTNLNTSKNKIANDSTSSSQITKEPIISESVSIEKVRFFDILLSELIKLLENNSEEAKKLLFNEKIKNTIETVEQNLKNVKKADNINLLYNIIDNYKRQIQDIHNILIKYKEIHNYSDELSNKFKGLLVSFEEFVFENFIIITEKGKNENFDNYEYLESKSKDNKKVKITKILKRSFNFGKKISKEIAINIEKKIKKLFWQKNKEYQTICSKMFRLLKSKSKDLLELFDKIDIQLQI